MIYTLIDEPTFGFQNPAQSLPLGGDFRITTTILDTTHGSVDKFFINDGPSIPRIARIIVPPRDMLLAATWHDAACTGGLIGDDPDSVSYTRWIADALLREAVISEQLMYCPRSVREDKDEFARYLKDANWLALKVWLGVLIGSRTGYKTIIPGDIIERGIDEVSQITSTSVNDLDFDFNINKVIPKAS
jgi:hypothetical protein